MGVPTNHWQITFLDMVTCRLWLDPLHLQYIIEGEESVMCLNALREHIPYLYLLANDVKNLELKNLRQDDIERWIAHNGLDVNNIN